MFYVEHGFVLFVPYRRGQGRSKGAGVDINTIYSPTQPDSPAFADALVTQADDVMAAIAYVASFPYVDTNRIATSGCSLWGIESLSAAELGTEIIAAIDFAGASSTWATNAPLRERMKVAARNAKVLVFFLQAENDSHATPSRGRATSKDTSFTVAFASPQRCRDPTKQPMDSYDTEPP